MTSVRTNSSLQAAAQTPQRPCDVRHRRHGAWPREDGGEDLAAAMTTLAALTIVFCNTVQTLLAPPAAAGWTGRQGRVERRGRARVFRMPYASRRPCARQPTALPRCDGLGRVLRRGRRIALPVVSAHRLPLAVRTLRRFSRGWGQALWGLGCACCQAPRWISTLAGKMLGRGMEEAVGVQVHIRRSTPHPLDIRPSCLRASRHFAAGIVRAPSLGYTWAHWPQNAQRTSLASKRSHVEMFTGAQFAWGETLREAHGLA